MATEQDVARLQEEWQAEGLDSEEIGARLRELAERSEREAENDPEPEPTTEPEPEPEAVDEEAYPLCPVCGGIGRIPRELQQSPGQRTCRVCQGLGEVRTGSLKPDAAVTLCTACNGNGWEYVEAQTPAPTDEPAPWERRY